MQTFGIYLKRANSSYGFENWLDVSYVMGPSVLTHLEIILKITIPMQKLYLVLGIYAGFLAHR